MRAGPWMLPLLCLSAPALAQSAQGDVAVTIYNNDLALVQDVRQIAIPAGRSRQEFPDVSARIRPETVSFAAADTGIIEQNFDYDLLSPSKLMEKAVGRTVTIVRTNPANGAETREQAKILAVNGGVVLQIGQRIEVLRDDGLPVRVIFDKVPDNLRARPTLSITIDSARAGTRPARLSYLTPGLGWNADYVARFDEAAGKIDVQGWVTLNNSTGTSFANADVVMVAGNPSQNGRSRPMPGRRDPALTRAGTESGTRERLGDYYLYPLKERTTIADAQTKQVSFLDVQGTPARKAYEYRVGWLQTIEEPQSAATVLKFTSSKDGGLGDQLPAGTVRVYMKDAKGDPQFIGENAIPHTPMGSELAIRTGEAFDVKVKSVVTERTRLDSRRWRTAMRYTLTNARPDAVTVDLIQDGLDWAWTDTRITAESQKSDRPSSNSAQWKVAVPANGESELTATFETRF
ncbi:DUF4139 domain-containing protein [Sphingomonas sp. KC8]|uniref:DUF4139 domain-containing protein n=1 Tax=Sphingomonas sp. KC8 TaxID=1030157 RepID=UPI00031C221B|nr:DUF4139 domain-containing protein [Sphingomonas sp. KC8]ARS28065.1 hypothetical protein KC8_12350 [Sphingomonas sp. KC8]